MGAPRIPRSGSYGLLAEYPTPEALVEACAAARAAGYTKLDAYTPYPIEAVWEALGHHRSRVPLLVLAGGLAGCLGGFALQYWTSAIAYPMNVGGRPTASWIAFIVPSFEMTILVAALAAVLGMFALNGLPMPYHPVFNSTRFAGASRDRYFLMIGTMDERYDAVATRALLESHGATAIEEVPA